MKKRKGKFTIANLMGGLVLFFLVWVMLPAINMALDSAWSGANFLTKAAIVLILPALIFAVPAYMLVAAQPRFETVKQEKQVSRRRLRR